MSSASLLFRQTIEGDPCWSCACAWPATGSMHKHSRLAFSNNHESEVRFDRSRRSASERMWGSAIRTSCDGSLGRVMLQASGSARKRFVHFREEALHVVALLSDLRAVSKCCTSSSSTSLFCQWRCPPYGHTELECTVVQCFVERVDR